MLRALSVALLSLLLSVPAFAQSQAANGAIEGTVTDATGGVLPGVTVTITQHRHGHRARRRHERDRTVPRAAAAARHL